VAGLLFALLFLCLPAAAQPSTIWWALGNWNQPGTTSPFQGTTNATIITPVASTPTINGDYLVTGLPKRFTPYAGGFFTNTTITPGNYRLDIENIAYPQPIYFQVPPISGTYRMLSLRVSGGNFFVNQSGATQALYAATAGVVTNGGSGAFTGSFSGDGSGLVNLPSSGSGYGMIDARTYGVGGPGDNAANLQRAVNAAQDLPGQLSLAGQSFGLWSTVVIPNGVVVDGEGATITNYGSGPAFQCWYGSSPRNLLVVNPGYDGTYNDTLASAVGFEFKGNVQPDNIEVRNLSIGYLVYQNLGDNANIQNVYCYHANYGLMLTNYGYNGSWLGQAEIMSCAFGGCLTGIVMQVNSGSASLHCLDIQGVDIADCTNGIVLDGFTGVGIDFCDFERNLNCDIMGINCAGFTVRGNSLQGTHTNIFLSNCQGVDISGQAIAINGASQPIYVDVNTTFNWSSVLSGWPSWGIWANGGWQIEAPPGGGVIIPNNAVIGGTLNVNTINANQIYSGSPVVQQSVCPTNIAVPAVLWWSAANALTYSTSGGSSWAMSNQVSGLTCTLTNGAGGGGACPQIADPQMGGATVIQIVRGGYQFNSAAFSLPGTSFDLLIACRPFATDPGVGVSGTSGGYIGLFGDRNVISGYGGTSACGIGFSTNPSSLGGMVFRGEAWGSDAATAILPSGTPVIIELTGNSTSFTLKTNGVTAYQSWPVVSGDVGYIIASDVLLGGNPYQLNFGESAIWNQQVSPTDMAPLLNAWMTKYGITPAGVQSVAGLTVKSNLLSIIPATPSSPGDVFIGNTNGTPYVVQSGQGQTWLSTNLLLSGNGANLTNIPPSGIQTNGAAPNQVLGWAGGNNSVAWVNASGGGTVTSVGLSIPGFTITSSPVTGSGTLTATPNGPVITNYESTAINLTNTGNVLAGSFSGPTSSAGYVIITDTSGSLVYITNGAVAISNANSGVVCLMSNSVFYGALSGTATKATADASGNTITSTYETQTAAAGITNTTTTGATFGNVAIGSSGQSTIGTTGGGTFAGITNNGVSAVKRTAVSYLTAWPSATSYTLTTNAAFTLTPAATGGSDTLELYSSLIVRNSSAPTPFLITIGGAGAGTCALTNGWSAALAVTNYAEIYRKEDQYTNLVVILH
jgi:hypothetical protein